MSLYCQPSTILHSNRMRSSAVKPWRRANRSGFVMGTFSPAGIETSPRDRGFSVYLYGFLLGVLFVVFGEEVPHSREKVSMVAVRDFAALLELANNDPGVTMEVPGKF